MPCVCGILISQLIDRSPEIFTFLRSVGGWRSETMIELRQTTHETRANNETKN